MKNKLSKSYVENDILSKHNHSWYEDILLRNSDRRSKFAMLYRGRKFTYGDFFVMVERYARALKQKGVSKEDEFVVCLQQTPDYPALVAAASLIGAKINLINSAFDLTYISQIIEKASASIILINDWDFCRLLPVIQRFPEKEFVMLPVDFWIEKPYPHQEIIEQFQPFDRDEFMNAVNTVNNLVWITDFLKEGEKYEGDINGHGKLDDDLAITYSSGSTAKGIHKGIVQKNRTYIIMGRYHDPEVAGIPRMDNTVTMGAVGTHADTTLLSGVSDTLLQGGMVALEPIINEDYFLYSLKINNPGLVIATRTYWLRAMKQTYENPYFKDLRLPFLYVPSEGGEPLSAGEEIALNKWLKKVRAGTAITHTPVSIVKMSVGGGDSEHGSLFLSLFRGYKNWLQFFRGIQEPIGLDYYDFVDIKVLRNDGTYCNSMEMGQMVANSPISMEKYHNDPIATEKYFITDAFGKKWGDLGTYGYIDRWKKVYIKGRIQSDDPEIKPFQIGDVILRDKRNIMSCEVIYLPEKNIYVAHLEMQYFKNVNTEKVLLRAEKLCSAVFGDYIKGRLFFRVRQHEEGFPTLFTAKRNLFSLKQEGVTSAFLPSERFQK